MNDSSKAGVPSMEIQEQDSVIQSKPKEKSPKSNSSNKYKGKSAGWKEPKDKRKDEKCLLIDFDDSDSEEDEEFAFARNNTPVERGFKLIKNKNIEVLDLNDL